MDIIGLPGIADTIQTAADSSIPQDLLSGWASDPTMFSGAQGGSSFLGIPSSAWGALGPILAGAAGPLAGLLGGVASGGQGPTQTQSGTSNFGNTQSGTSSALQTLLGNTGFANTGTVTPQLLGPAAQAGQYAQGALQMMSPLAQGLYGQGAGLLSALGGQMAAGGLPGQQQVQSIISQLQGQGSPGIGSFMNVSMTPDPAIAKLVKQAYQPYVGSLTQQAIESARSRGFAGGADLLGGAAGPVAAQALANLPGMEANTLLQQMLAIPQTQAQIGAAESQAMANAAGIPIQALTAAGQLANAQTGQQANLIPSLIQMMMNPLNQQFQGQLGLLTGYPAGSTQQQSGTGTQSQSQQSQGQTQGQQTGTSGFGTTGTSQVPMGNLVGQGIGSILQGGAAGAAASQTAANQNALQQAIINALNRGGGNTLSGVPTTG